MNKCWLKKDNYLERGYSKVIIRNIEIQFLWNKIEVGRFIEVEAEILVIIVKLSLMGCHILHSDLQLTQSHQIWVLIPHRMKFQLEFNI
jgi:hypothetical protein